MLLAILQTLGDTLDGWYALNSPRSRFSTLERTNHSLKALVMYEQTKVFIGYIRYKKVNCDARKQPTLNN
jgi:hypothetical protein